MKARCLALLLVPCLAFAQEGTIPDSELSLGGATIGHSLEAVVAAMGKPKRQEAMEDFIDLRYHYPHVRVSFNAEIVAALDSVDAKACTPKGLCPGDGYAKMRSLYGAPRISERETGRVLEYYGSDGACWLEVPDAGEGKTIPSLAVVCMP